MPGEQAGRAGGDVGEHPFRVRVGVRGAVFGQHPPTQVGEDEGPVQQGDVDTHDHVVAQVEVDRHVRAAHAAWRTDGALADRAQTCQLGPLSAHRSVAEARAAGDGAARDRAVVEDRLQHDGGGAGAALAGGCGDGGSVVGHG
ncbi:hypothetical protein [Pseudonocardia oroxyli]|uniref:hypothetical protein n=1 Tax=Pseudonocardia oroxyli TaxID=366584 RepID=UPI001FDF102A|nr:hypothetical protein [Pseudonocardia oroxyli]